jgi:hypothetical protein
MKINKGSDINKSKQIVELADKSAHKVERQTSYISPLKGLNGNPIYEIDELKSANDKIKQIVINYNTRSKGKAPVPVPAPKNKGKK